MTINIKFRFLAATAAVLITAKLTGVVVWSWWWVTLPLWLIPALGILLWACIGGLLLLGMVIAFLAEILPGGFNPITGQDPEPTTGKKSWEDKVREMTQVQQERNKSN